MSPEFAILEVRLFERPVKMRLPFRFGDTVVTETAEAHIRVLLDGPLGRNFGQSAQLMVPRWFDKNADLENAETVEELRETLRHAARAAEGLTGTVAVLARCIRTIVRDTIPDSVPDLACGFGPAVIEMALIDAACRSAGKAFPDAARSDIFGLVDQYPPDLSADDMRNSLASLTLKWSIAVRHTVGYDSPLLASDVTNRPDDAPVSLDEVIADTGISSFKIKLKGDPEGDIRRMQDIAGVLEVLPHYRATLDANEQYDEPGFNAFLTRFSDTVGLDRLREATAFIEQPFPREIALSVNGPVPPDSVPIIIDESDDSEDAFGVAMARGWAGTSVKSCKGVLRALINKTRVEIAANAGRKMILSAEDLTCQPGLCWQQDSLMAAVIGADHVERNGHFFAGGMQGASPGEKSAFLSAHPDIYRATESGPRLRIVAGRVNIRSLDAAGFASVVAPDLNHDQLIEF